MTCTPTDAHTEMEFVHSLTTRSREVGECRGPLLRIALWSGRVVELQRIFHSRIADELLWSGVHPDGALGIHFSLCAAHWVDLAALCWVRARGQAKREWAVEALRLLRDVCQVAGWDAKELSNMLSWHGARLT